MFHNLTLCTYNYSKTATTTSGGELGDASTTGAITLTGVGNTSIGDAVRTDGAITINITGQLQPCET